MKAFYFTFWRTHPLRDFVQKIVASDEDKARAIMYEFYGIKWAFCYGPFNYDGIEDGQKSVTLHGYTYRLIPHNLNEGETLC